MYDFKKIYIWFYLSKETYTLDYPHYFSYIFPDFIIRKYFIKKCILQQKIL
ncbi:hypothetical protein LbFV_ORF64 [Leptopilina boulardi filamentous virus]|uniref:Uncharacterized protein n=1 Tax=Leptopilina boulardi filamentous virus TaxID=552509 RepID=A0A1S5YDB7_9VIRU|nr:hypothetical protein LbFV_ORF64 [Leptopilina boulardi filamentous virus]AQQ79984.1 hypothetical protein LbFV_ORF64 [Leptopilina boulardi filamentous virus]